LACTLRKKHKLGEHVFILAFIIIQLVLNTAAKILMLNAIANTGVYQINSFLSLLIASLYFGKKFAGCRIKNIPVIYAGAGVTLLALLAIIFTENRTIFNSRSYSYTAFVITAYAITYYYNKLAHPAIAGITASRTFWFVTGLFFYYSGCFIIFCTYKLFVQIGKGNFQILWSIHNFIILVMCIILSIGFRCKSYQKT